jgi:hypothetical protein
MSIYINKILEKNESSSEMKQMEVLCVCKLLYDLKLIAYYITVAIKCFLKRKLEKETKSFLKRVMRTKKDGAREEYGRPNRFPRNMYLCTSVSFSHSHLRLLLPKVFTIICERSIYQQPRIFFLSSLESRYFD